MTSPVAYRVAADVAYIDGNADGDDACYVAVLPSGPPVVLSGPAAAIWRELRHGGTAADLTQRVAETVGVPSSDIHGDVESFVEELVRLGILQREPPS